jgi:pyruvate/2-oxoglutarate/acetoin dehydrogenase E1 component
LPVRAQLFAGNIESSSRIRQTVLAALNAALHQSMEGDERVILLGEDLLDPYGGAFKVTQGLSTAYPDQVFTTPISEAGIVGIAAGMALRGLHPVVELMFGDFITLAADQLINHIAKFRWMYNEGVRVPLVIRTPMGGRRGYGPTHSQTLEKIFLGAPGLRVLAPSALGNPGALLASAIQDEEPVLFIENKLLYSMPIHDKESLAEFDAKQIKLPHIYAPSFSLTVTGAPAPELTIATYGYMAELARQAVQQLAYDDEIFAELIVMTQLSPFDLTPILTSVRRTGRLLTVEEGTFTLGWGAEVLARCIEALGSQLQGARRIAAQDLPIPASTVLEEEILPGVDDIISSARLMIMDG